MKARAILLWTTALIIVVGLASVVVWWRLSERREIPLESHWTATTPVIAGDGVAGFRDGDAAHARFADPFGVAIAEDGTIYVADAGEAPRIRTISPQGIVSTTAGGELGFADGVGAAARFNTPSGLAIDPQGTLYVADTGNNAIRRIGRDGRVSTVAGDGIAGDRDGPASQARFNGPVGVAVDAAGRVVVADTYNDRIRAIDANGLVTTIAGSSLGAVDGSGADARFDTPCGVAVDRSGTIYVADTGNGVVRAISPTGIVTSRVPPLPDGLFRPVGIAVAATNVYVTDDRGRVVEMSANGATRVLAGSRPGFSDGDGADARFRRPSGLAAAVPGRLVVTDAGNALVRLLVARSRREPRLPALPALAPQFDVETFEQQPLLWPVDPMEGPFEIAGTMGEARGSEGAERFHAGVDIRADEGTPVHAVRDGVVVSPDALTGFGTLNESLRVGALAYVHVRAGREQRNELIDPERFVPTYDEAGGLIRLRVKRGARFVTGETIGTVNAFNHVHLNVGWPGEEYNPLRFRVPQFQDTVAPSIARGGVRLYSDEGQLLIRRVKGRTLVHGVVHVVVDAWDQVDGNKPQRRLGLYTLGYQVLERDGTPAPGFTKPRETIRFDRMSSDPDAPRIVYAPGSGIPFYGRRTTRFLYDVTNTFRDGVASAARWDTSTLPPGNYTLRITAADIRGNQAMKNRDLPITIQAASEGDPAGR